MKLASYLLFASPMFELCTEVKKIRERREHKGDVSSDVG
jgi:hypothetical protein